MFEDSASRTAGAVKKYKRVLESKLIIEGADQFGINIMDQNWDTD